MLTYTISTASQFRDEFARYGRKDQFSYDALGMLFDYFDDIDESVELDVVGICCEYCEMDADEVRADYRLDDDADVEAYLNDNTCVIGQTDAGAYVFAQF